MYTNQSKLILAAIGVFVTLSLFVFPSTSMIAYSQSENQTRKGASTRKAIRIESEI